MAEIHCRHFNGYKPCGLSTDCSRSCEHFDEVRRHVVIVHLGALGAVLRSTALLPAIHRAYPKATLTWVTKAPAQELLEHNPLIDRVLTLSPDDQLALQVLEADAVFCIDKSLTAIGIASLVNSAARFGFRADPLGGAILPATAAARELWEIGLSNQKKFFENTKTENRLVHEALELGEYRRDPYQYFFTDLEEELAQQRRELWLGGKTALIGLNTGCSAVIPYKKLTVGTQRRLVKDLHSKFGSFAKIALLEVPKIAFAIVRSPMAWTS